MTIFSKLTALAGGAAVFLPGVLAPAAFAEEADSFNGHFYAGLGVSGIKAESEAGVSSDFTTGFGRLGYRFTPNIAVEGEIGVGLGGESDSSAPLLDVEINSYWGGFGVLSLPVGSNVDLFARAGVVNMDIGGFSSGSQADDSGDMETALGAGVIAHAGWVDVRFDFTHIEFDGGSANAGSISIGTRF